MSKVSNFWGLTWLGVCAIGLSASAAVQETPALPPAPPKTERPNIIILTVDTLRADHLTCYGYERDTTPNIDSLARDSVLFSNAITVRPVTGPGLAAMLTGRYPYQTGVWGNFVQLHASNVSVAETLKEAGYQTAAFVSNYVLIRDLSKFDQGFDVYDDYMSEREANRDVFERRAADTIDQVAMWLKKKPTSPFFLWVHLIDPHGPYDPPPPFNKKYRGTVREAVAADDIPDYQKMKGVPNERGAYIDRYDGEIAYCDQQIGRFLDNLRQSGLYDKSLVVFSADHGESLGEHNMFFEHGPNVMEPCLHIPMIVKWPKGKVAEKFPPGKNDRLVSLLDVAPTILEMAGLDRPKNYEGRSFTEVLSDATLKDRKILIEALRPKKVGGRDLGIRTADSKLFYKTKSEHDCTIIDKHYYTMANDAGEVTNRYATLDDAGARLDAEVAKFVDIFCNHKLPFEPVHFKPKSGKKFISSRTQGDKDDDHTKALKKLGYVDDEEENETEESPDGKKAADSDDQAKKSSEDQDDTHTKALRNLGYVDDEEDEGSEDDGC